MCCTVLLVGGCIVSKRKPVTEGFVERLLHLPRQEADFCAAATYAYRLHEAACETRYHTAVTRYHGRGGTAAVEVEFLITSATLHLNGVHATICIINSTRCGAPMLQRAREDKLIFSSQLM